MAETRDEELNALIYKIIQHDIQNLQNDDHYRYGHNHALIVDSTLIECYIKEKQFRDSIHVDSILNRSLNTLYCMFSCETGVTKEHSVVYQSHNFYVLHKFLNLLEKNSELH